MAQLDEALEAGAEVILLDNFQPRDMAEAVKRIRERRPQTVIEASGGVSLDRIRDIGKTGVDVISIGALTHSARAIDFSCEIPPRRRRAASSARTDTVDARPRAMDEVELAARLRTRWLGRVYEWHAACASTNDLAAERARAGAPAGLVIAADEQSAGRGRLGRAWHSPAGENLYVSILLRPARPPPEIPPLTLLAGAAVARALARSAWRRAQVAQRRGARG